MSEISSEETDDWDWYILIKLPLSTSTPLNPTLISEYSLEIEQFHQQITSTIYPKPTHLSPPLLTTPTKSHLIRSIGIPTLPSPEISTCRKLAREWARSTTAQKSGNVEVRFVPRKGFLELRGELEGFEAGDSSEDMGGDEEDDRSTGKSKKQKEEGEGSKSAKFTKIKGSNPAQVRRQFLEYQMRSLSLSTSSLNSTSASTSKHRPGKEILNQLRFDPAYEVSDFIVGYIDRKEGILERSVEEWVGFGGGNGKGKEELMAYVKNLRTGLVVWDRGEVGSPRKEGESRSVMMF